MASWYPTLRSTLLLLSKLYLTVNTPIFEAIAQEALEECTWSITKASQLIGSREGTLHGRLFYLQHLLVLNEQIKSFDIDFQMTERSLDLSQIRESLNTLASGGFRTLWSSLTQPRVHDSQKNSKRDLEQSLSLSLKELFDEHVGPISQDVNVLIAAIGSQMDVASDLLNLPRVLVAFENAVIEKVAPMRASLSRYLRAASVEAADQIIEQLRTALIEPFVLLYPLIASHYPAIESQIPALEVLIAKINTAFTHTPQASTVATLDL